MNSKCFINDITGMKCLLSAMLKFWTPQSSPMRLVHGLVCQRRIKTALMSRKKGHLAIMGQRGDIQNHNGCAKLKASKRTHMAYMPLTILPTLQHIMTRF